MDLKKLLLDPFFYLFCTILVSLFFISLFKCLFAFEGERGRKVVKYYERGSREENQNKNILYEKKSIFNKIKRKANKQGDFRRRKG